jgi:prepilin-type N-terminal cleavage/methylation domain-containing protein
MIFLKRKKDRGFTLIEMILYLAIAGTILYFIGGFAFDAIFGKSKIETVQDVNQNSQAVLDEMSKTINDSLEVIGSTGE